ncbi:MAG: winged helix-turn-helix transcriptional regulator [Lachnospiraceae bacterium]|nr:winged helix-turn-helix transcriptional regulator [Lachnospiraceae bacterium]
MIWFCFFLKCLETSDKIIDILETKSDISVNEIAEILEISVGGVGYHV